MVMYSLSVCVCVCLNCDGVTAASYAIRGKCADIGILFLCCSVRQIFARLYTIFTVTAAATVAPAIIGNEIYTIE